jgi:hypothetical protein
MACRNFTQSVYSWYGCPTQSETGWHQRRTTVHVHAGASCMQPSAPFNGCVLQASQRWMAVAVLVVLGAWCPPARKSLCTGNLTLWSEKLCFALGVHGKSHACSSCSPCSSLMQAESAHAGQKCRSQCCPDSGALMHATCIKHTSVIAVSCRTVPIANGVSDTCRMGRHR